MRIRNIIQILVVILFIISCESSQDLTSKKLEWENWKGERTENLKSLWGYMNLAGLYWLDEGENTIGSDSSNSIIFPSKAPDFLGTIVKNDSMVWFETRRDDVLIDSLTQKSGYIFGKEDGPKLVTHGSFLWLIIKRGERLGVRLIDTEHPKISADPDIKYFDFNPKFSVKAKFVPYPIPKKIPMADVIGTKYIQEFEGQLQFKIDGKDYTLEPITEGDKFFIIFSDETSALTTYGSGRYMYCKIPEPGETTLLDFNRSYNPPCAFTDFATCPIPPEENRLTLAIEAGELDFHF